MTPIEQEFERRKNEPSDINQHLQKLYELAGECISCTEFGTRSGNSTTALLAGLSKDSDATDIPTRLTSYDIADQQYTPPECFAKWKFIQADTSCLEEIAPTELLFIDTLHTFAQVEAELKHAPRVGRYLVFHDTVLFGFREETTGDLPGIMPAILNFMATTEGRKWVVESHAVNNCGLLVLRRVKA